MEDLVQFTAMMELGNQIVTALRKPECSVLRDGCWCMTIRDLSHQVGADTKEIQDLFGRFNINPRTWSYPSEYSIDEIKQQLTIHEVGNRYAR